MRSASRGSRTTCCHVYPFMFRNLPDLLVCIESAMFSWLMKLYKKEKEERSDGRRVTAEETSNAELQSKKTS